MPNADVSPFDSVEAAVQDIAAGKLVIVTDDEDRENEGDLIMAASKATPQTVNMMIRYCSGIICVPMIEAQLKHLGLGPMVSHNRESHRTDFTVTVDAAQGVTTGISAADRTETIKILADPNSEPHHLVQPGHVFPLRARPGGVLERAGHTEAAVDLARLADLPPSGVLCELVNDDGTVQRLPQLIAFKEKFGLKMISIAQLIQYRARTDRLVEKICSSPFSSEYGEFTAHVFRSLLDGRQHIALTAGQLDGEPALVRVHRENLLSDVFRGRGMRSRRNLDTSFSAIAKAGRGVMLYMEPSNPSELIAKRLQAIPGDPKISMSFREYGIGAQILRELGLKKIRLMTNSARRVIGLEGYGLEIVEQVAL